MGERAQIDDSLCGVRGVWRGEDQLSLQTSLLSVSDQNQDVTSRCLVNSNLLVSSRFHDRVEGRVLRLIPDDGLYEEKKPAGAEDRLLSRSPCSSPGVYV